ncbi:MAG: nuclear transport factor 2 family protein [Cyclobacteriaceae bacterium]|nr:nuclear transport factor 2 family protein [Cyclobacteriaceae bacterium]
MKPAFHYIALLLGMPLALAAQSDSEAIKRVIEKESTAYFNVDYKAWADTWVQAPHAYWSYTDLSGTRFLEGWDTMKTSLARYFKTAQPSSGEITNQWLEVRVYDTGAYVRFTQLATDGTDRTETAQIRVLEKENGQWRIVCMQATDRTSSR